MAPDVQIVPATEAHAADLATRLRDEDVEECMAASGEGPLQSLVGSIRLSVESWALLFDGRVVACYGVAPVPADPRLGGVWMLGAPDLRSHAKTFWGLCRPELARLSKLFPILLNYIPETYPAALRWAKRLGFEVHPAIPFGPLGLPFHPVVFRGTPCT